MEWGGEKERERERVKLSLSNKIDGELSLQ